MPNGDPRDGFFYLTLKLIRDSYILVSFSGLEHLIEYHSQDVNKENRFFCTLCEAELGAITVMQHMMTLKHRMGFFVSIIYVQT